MSLNDLFGQILQSEQKAKERKTLLNEVKNDITKVQEQLKDIKEKSISTQGELVVKLQCQTDAEVSLAWLRHKKSILTQQLSSVAKERDAALTRLQSLEASQAKKYEDFMEELSSFNQMYDLCGGGREQREAEARQCMKELIEQEQGLLKELSGYRESQARRRRLIIQRKHLETEIDNLKRTQTDFTRKLEQEKHISRNLDAVKERTTKLPLKDAEFISLRSKLDACHSEGSQLEAAGHTLQQQVECLQRQRWQQQLQRQASQATATATSSAAVSRAQERNETQRRADQRQAKSNVLEFTRQSNHAETWSSFRVTHSFSTSTCAPPNQQELNHPSASCSATQSVESVSGKGEPPLLLRGGAKPNLAKLRRGKESEGGKLSERPASLGGTRQFKFQRTSSYNASKNPKQGSLASYSNKGNKSHTDSERISSQDTQVPGTAKKVRFK